MIEIGELKPQLLILLIYPVGIFCARLITQYFISNPLFYLFLFFISHFLSLIPLLIYKINKSIAKKQKNLQENFNNNTERNDTLNDSGEMKNQLEILKEKIKKEKKRNSILIFFLISFLYFSTYVFFYYFNYIVITNYYGNISIITEVLYFSLFNRFIFGNKVYSHHFFSMILITISIIALYILVLIKHINEKWDPFKDFLFPTILNFVVYCPFCYFLVKGKSYIEKYFISIYQLILYLGIFCLILLIILEPISYYIPCDYDDNKYICDNKHFAGIISGLRELSGIGNILYCFGLIIFLFMTTLGLWLTVKMLSPGHFLTSDSIITLELNMLVDGYRGSNTAYLFIDNPLFYIFSFITIFACLIYNEILIINICNLNYNTRKEIIERQTHDYKCESELTGNIERIPTHNTSEDE